MGVRDAFDVTVQPRRLRRFRKGPARFHRNSCPVHIARTVQDNSGIGVLALDPASLPSGYRDRVSQFVDVGST
jgi:hypothetical protein